MQSAQVDLLDRRSLLPESNHRRDVGREQDAWSRIATPFGRATRRLDHARKEDFDFGWHSHAIEILLPVAGCHLVIDQRDEPNAERAPPSNDHLTMDQPVIDAVEHERHQRDRIASPPLAAARRAASSAVAPRWNTKSTSIGRLTPVTTGS